MGGRRITTTEAVIKTASVEVRTLTLSGKQMTLAVFRQLLPEPLIDLETSELRGVPWGRVNYCPSKCYQSSHLHVVWQKGSELRQSTIPGPNRPYHLSHDQKRSGMPDDEVEAIDKRWARHYAELAALDQLFIAV